MKICKGKKRKIGFLLQISLCFIGFALFIIKLSQNLKTCNEFVRHQTTKKCNLKARYGQVQFITTYTESSFKLQSHSCKYNYIIFSFIFWIHIQRNITENSNLKFTSEYEKNKKVFQLLSPTALSTCACLFSFSPDVLVAILHRVLPSSHRQKLLKLKVVNLNILLCRHPKVVLQK